VEGLSAVSNLQTGGDSAVQGQEEGREPWDWRCDLKDTWKLHLSERDHDIEVTLPTGKKILFQYREESGLVDICAEPLTGVTVYGKDAKMLTSASAVEQICIGIHRDHE
jgi:hypothetical protein